MATIFKRNGDSSSLIQYFDSSGRRRERSTSITDNRAAERLANKLEADAALRREGVIDGRQVRFSEEALIRLTWASVNLDDGLLTIRNGKAKREDQIPLHTELLEEFELIHPADVRRSTRVFTEEVTNRFA